MDGFGDSFREAQTQFKAEEVVKSAPWPFTCLGHDRGRFFLYPQEGGQVLAFSGRDLSSAGELMKLAPLQWFELAYPSKGESFSAKAAADAIMRACYKIGVFNPDAMRGRGVWIDEGRRVMHLGSHLLVDGIPTALHEHQSRFIYERARPLRVDLGEPLSDAEGKRFLAMCRSIAFANPDRDGSFLAGWIVSALVGGALAWRPHLWLLAEGGSGKTWVHDNVLVPAFGDFALILQGKTTEAGVRGDLGNDARPVFFDEAETQSDRDRERIQQVIDLARQASSEHAGPIVKGTKEGGSRRFAIRSSFMFGSINAGLTQAADESRFVTLTLDGGDPEQFARLKTAHAEAMVKNFAGRLLARCLAMVPTIRHNAEVIADAIARSGAGRRAGDTIGTLIACHMSLVGSQQLTTDQAGTIVAGQQWVRDAVAESRIAPEWERALLHLMQGEGIRVSSGGRNETLSIAELVSACWAFTEGGMHHLDAKRQLGRMGIRPDGDWLLLGNRSDAIAKRFRETPWASGWGATLARVPGAKRGRETWFGSAYGKDKALAIPISLVVGGAENGS